MERQSPVFPEKSFDARKMPFLGGKMSGLAATATFQGIRRDGPQPVSSGGLSQKVVGFCLDGIVGTFYASLQFAQPTPDSKVQISNNKEIPSTKHPGHQTTKPLASAGGYYHSPITQPTRLPDTQVTTHPKASDSSSRGYPLPTTHYPLPTTHYPPNNRHR